MSILKIIEEQVLQNKGNSFYDVLDLYDDFEIEEYELMAGISAHDIDGN